MGTTYACLQLILPVEIFGRDSLSRQQNPPENGVKFDAVFVCKPAKWNGSGYAGGTPGDTDGEYDSLK